MELWLSLKNSSIWFLKIFNIKPQHDFELVGVRGVVPRASVVLPLKGFFSFLAALGFRPALRLCLAAAGLLSSGDAQASPCSGFSYCRATGSGVSGALVVALGL